MRLLFQVMPTDAEFFEALPLLNKLTINYVGTCKDG